MRNKLDLIWFEIRSRFGPYQIMLYEKIQMQLVQTEDEFCSPEKIKEILVMELNVMWLLHWVWRHLHFDGNFRFTKGLRAHNRIIVEMFLCINFVLSSDQVMITHMNP